MAEEWVSEFDTASDLETEWTAANIQEALPGVLTPMSWSMIGRILEYAFARPGQRVGVVVPHRDPYVASFYGRAYLNVTVLRAGAERIPGNSPEALDEHYLGKARDASRPATRPTLRQVAGYLPVLPRMLWLILRSEAEIRDIEGRSRAGDALNARLDPETATLAQLVERIEAGIDLGREAGAVHIGVSGAASAAFELLGKLTKDWLGDDDGSLQATLCSGLADIESARPSKALWDLSRLSLRSETVAAALDPAHAAQALAGLRLVTDDRAAQRFVEGYDIFIRRFGHRGVMEGEVAALSWEEDPATVLTMIRTLRRSGPEADPYVREACQRRLREEATAAALARLSPLRRAAFRRVLAQAQRYVSDRERTKSLFMRGTNAARRLLRQLGRHLVADGRLEREGDLYYLTLEEAEALARGEEVPDVEARIARRRAEEEKNRDVILPESFKGRPRPIEAAVGETATVLKGIPVSPGRVSGFARVILDPREDAHIEPGEILVAPVTDAAWTPLFLTAAAVVVDVGGPLSHGATVARELGLPAVVNVKQGTRLIRSGQRITVDGREGTVTLDGV